MNDRKYRVIVVEDENLIAKNIAKNIEKINPNYVVVGIFSNGEDALCEIEALAPDVIFTDISMPVMTGLELAAKIRDKYSNIKVVILTGYADFEYAKEAIHCEVEDYLLKPINKDELEKTLKKIELLIPAVKGDVNNNLADNNYSPEEIVTLVKEYVQKNYSKDIDLNSISENLGFSSSYLTKVFNKVENTSPLKYIRNYRMSIAKQLLMDKNLTIAQVAENVGYNDPFHFSKSFKQTFGISPSELKREYYE